MKEYLYKDAREIVNYAISSVLPEETVKKTLNDMSFPGRVIVVAIGKAGWRMAKAALECLPRESVSGVVITKYGHSKGDLPGINCFEAGHPIPDKNSISATKRVLEMTNNLTDKETVLFLLSGGGSALFEKPYISLNELQNITNQLLESGADIKEINTIRKRLSEVKGGRFALHCAPAQIESIVLSDVLGDSLDMIASGPAVADASTSKEALYIIEKYNLKLNFDIMKLLLDETPKCIQNVHTQIIGNVKKLCEAAERKCVELGYKPIILTDCLNCEAREAGRFLSSIVQSHKNSAEKIAFITGGETVVHLSGKGLGGRNQELALSAAEGISGLDAAVISVGSDGTDGPTDAAGGYVDGDTLSELTKKGWNITKALQENDSYHALKSVNGLVITGPTGTNVNDITIALTAY